MTRRCPGGRPEIHPSAYGAQVNDTQTSERLSFMAGLLASLAAGLPVLLETLRAGGDRLVGPAWAWWACYLGYLAVFVVGGLRDADRRPRWLGDRTLLVVQIVLGVGAVVLAPAFGWSAVLLVVNAVSAAYLVSRRATIAIVTTQVLILAVVVSSTTMAPLDAGLTVLVYGSFQAFAAVIVWAQQREAAARSALAEAHAELHAATTLLATSSRAEERLRIARDLHDLVGHQLTALALELEAATLEAASRASTSPTPVGRPPAPAVDAPSVPTTSLHVQRARGIAKELLTDVREAVGELRAPQPGLGRALEAVTTGLPRPDVELSVDDELAVDDQTTLALVRCVQEIVTNTARHADATTLRIEVMRPAGGGVRLVAYDDGRGAEQLRPGNGLAGITERIEGLGGTVEFVTAPGQGLRVVARVPPS